MLREEDVLATAQTYRRMATMTHDPTLKLELIERAERYELVASTLHQHTEAAKSTGCAEGEAKPRMAQRMEQVKRGVSGPKRSA